MRRTPDKEKRNKMLGLIPKYGLRVLEPDLETLKLADVYVAAGVIPKNYHTDSLHIAISTVNDIDMILSLNFKHIVSKRTEDLTGNINMLNGYRKVEIRPPMEVVENEKT